MTISIHQPNYIPWSGYFHKIARSDVFIILDNVQYVKGGVANRNIIKSKTGIEVPLSVSVKLSKGSFAHYNEMEIDYSSKWNHKHINQIRDAYIKAPYFNTIFPLIEQILKTKFATIAQLNTKIILLFLELLKIKTTIYICSQLNIDFGINNERNVNICKHFNASKYLSGNGAKAYNIEASYNDNNIKLLYSKYKSVPYQQINGAFISNLSILDMFFNLSTSEIYEIIYQKEIVY